MKNIRGMLLRNTKVTERPNTSKLSPSLGQRSSTVRPFLELKNTFQRGREAESRVANLLRENNFEIIRQNFRTPYGEVDLVAKKEKTLWFFEIKRRKEKSLKVHPPLSFIQRERLGRAMMWIWQNERKSYDHFQSQLVIVTERGIKWITLPLLYDRS